jgi:SHS2 domain-containing protein
MESEAFEFVAHTADVAVVVRGQTMPELLRCAGSALYSLVMDDPTIATVEHRLVAIESVDADALLIDWINELIYLFYAEGMAFSEFRFDELNDTGLRAECRGERVDLSLRATNREVKAATYHMAHISRVGKGLVARIVLDV